MTRTKSDWEKTITAPERLRAAVDTLRVHVGLAIMPADTARALRGNAEIELGVIHLRMVIGDDADALMESFAAAFNASNRNGIRLVDALEAERRHVTQHGPRYTT
jgi:hypothetical protein